MSTRVKVILLIAWLIVLVLFGTSVLWMDPAPYPLEY